MQQIKGSADVDDLRRSYNSKRSASKVLYKAGRYVECIYLGGYALEILLKVYITKKLGLRQMPDCLKTHHLESLLFVAGLEDAKKGDPVLNANFTAVNTCWNENIRYEDPRKHVKATAKRFLNALLGGRKGLIPWLRAEEKKL
jgi:HEPN domain-containing protein